MTRSAWLRRACVLLVLLLPAVFLWWPARASFEPGIREPASGADRGSPAPSLAPGFGSREPLPRAEEQGSTALPERGSAVPVRTIDADGRPVGGARLFLGSDEGVLAVGATDAHGLAALAVPAGSWHEITARKPGFAAAQASLQAPPPDGLVLCLRAPASISGRVVFADGTPAGAEVVVMAFPATRALSIQGDPQRILSEPQVLETRTDADGRFLLVDVDPSQRYSVLAGGLGLIQESWERNLVPGAGEVTLVVLRGYAAWVRFLEPDGSFPEASRAFGPGIGATAALIEPEARFAGHRELFACLSGVTSGPKPMSPWEILYVAGSSAALPLVTLELQVHPPGYERVQTRVTLNPLVDGPEPHDVLLRPTASDKGAVVLEREGGMPCTPDTRVGPYAVATLRSASGQTWQFPLEDVSRVRQRLEGIPFGRHAVALRLLSSRTLIPGEGQAECFVDVGPEPVVLGYDASAQGALEVRVFDAHGAPYRGELVIFLGAGRFDPARGAAEQGFSGDQLLFRRAPYLVQQLPPIPHSLRIESPGATGTWHAVEIVAGGTQRVDVSIDLSR